MLVCGAKSLDRAHAANWSSKCEPSGIPDKLRPFAREEKTREQSTEKRRGVEPVPEVVLL
jgi:hypothetical protein